MIGLIIALYEEAEKIIRQLDFQRIDGVAQYNGFLKGCHVSLHLSGPGVQRRTHIFKWLRQHRFESIINIGYAGALTSGFEAGEICKVSELNRVGEKKIPLNLKKGFGLVTTDRPVFSYDNKEELFLETNAKLVDMEAYKIAEIISEEEGGLSKLEIVKIVGDLPGDALYLRNEELFRGFFSSRSYTKKIRVILKTGLSHSWFLYNRKKKLQNILREYLEQRMGVYGKS